MYSLMKHTATHCNTEDTWYTIVLTETLLAVLQQFLLTATYCNTLQCTANTLQTHCNTLQHRGQVVHNSTSRNTSGRAATISLARYRSLHIRGSPPSLKGTHPAKKSPIYLQKRATFSHKSQQICKRAPYIH